ncbi:MAG: cyanophycin synthetase [Planctomycetaceae bacterium]|nr:cyanophycin synthetase [Planctomycetaceae bacterium]
MQLRNVRALRGPNVWTQATVLETTLELVSWREDTGGDLDAFRENLGRLLPGVLEPLCEPCRDGAASNGAVRPAGLLLAELFVRSVVELQAQSGSPVSYGRVAETAEPGCYRLAIQYREEPVGRQALDVAAALFQAARANQSFIVADHLRNLRQLDQQIRLGPSTGSIVRAAVNRGIPFRRLNEHSLVQIGYGSKQHRILAAETDKTSAVAESIVQDKQLTKQLLEAIGVPVPRGREVTSAEDAWAAAQDIGLPVVVKPKDGSQGRGVAVNLMTREQVLAAYAAASVRYDEVIVEKYAVGADYRLLIINQQLVAAARREPPLVIGDGRRTIRELVDEVNLDPRRGEDHATSLSKIPIDAIAEGVLADQGLNPSSIPAAGQIVLLRRNANLSTGGSAADVTDLVHPEVTARAIDATRMVGLDIAGVDIIAQDISRPLEQQGAVIIEVNAAPGLRMHLEPSSGQGRPVGEAIINMMFPEGDTGRIPIVAVTGVNGKTTTTRLSAHILRCWGKRTGMTCTDGVYINDRRVDTGDCSGPKSARNVLSNPVVEAAVLETARGGILREGLGFDRSDVSIVTNIGEGDHLGLNGIETLEQLARVKRAIVENVATTGYAVLNAADPLTAPMAAFCPGKVLFFARSSEQPVLAAHRARGGKVVFIRDNALIAAEGEWEAKIADLSAVPLTMGGLIGFQIENTMAAAAGAWTLGVPLQTIRHALETFVNTAAKAPARFNVTKFRGATIVIDYGHNVSAIEALLEAFGQMPHERRLIVYTAAGDRRDEDIIRQAELIADGFDHWVLYEDACTRGRADGEVIRLMKQGIQQGKRLKSCLETRGEFNAISMTLDMMRAGDLVLVQADQVEAAIQFVDDYLARLAQSPTATNPVSVG